MKKFSQGDEQDFILEYFKDNKGGNFIDIGGYNPEIFSNTRALFELGWSGVVVEPSDGCYPTLEEFYKGTGVETYHCAIGTETGMFDFWDSNGDALSSTDPEHIKKWTENYGSTFTKMQKQFFTLEDLIEQSQYKSFNFVSIDVENDRLGVDILKQFDLTAVGMICLEVGYDQPAKMYRTEVGQFLTGWKLLYQNAENVVYAR